MDDISSDLFSKKHRCQYCNRICNGSKGLKIHLSKCNIAKNNTNEDSNNILPPKSTKLKNKRKCRSDCKTCPDLIKGDSFISTITGRTYNIINLNIIDIDCKLQNYIYIS